MKQISIVLSLRDTYPVVRDDGVAQGKGRRGQNKDSLGKNLTKCCINAEGTKELTPEACPRWPMQLSMAIGHDDESKEAPRLTITTSSLALTLLPNVIKHQHTHCVIFVQIWMCRFRMNTFGDTVGSAQWGAIITVGNQGVQSFGQKKVQICHLETSQELWLLSEQCSPVFFHE